MEKSQFLQWDIIIDEINNNEDADMEINISHLIEVLIEHIYDNKSYECMKYVREKLEVQEVWNRIEREVCSQTDFFIKTLAIKNMNDNIAIEKIKSVYEYRYKKYENDDYICEKVMLDKNQMKAIRCVFNYCEFSIILQKISKRRFQVFLVDKGKFKQFFMEEIWNLFDSNRKDIENLIYSRHLADLEMKVNYLMNGQDEIKDELNFTQYLILKDTDMRDDDI